VNRVSTKSTVNNDSAAVKFTLKLRDVCWDIPFVAAEFSSATATKYLWESF